LSTKALEVNSAFDKTADALKAAEKRLSDMSVLMKHNHDISENKAGI
jgi:hypothetical protein